MIDEELLDQNEDNHNRVLDKYMLRVIIKHHIFFSIMCPHNKDLVRVLLCVKVSTIFSPKVLPDFKVNT